jgi:hypothetical protein
MGEFTQDMSVSFSRVTEAIFLQTCNSSGTIDFTGIAKLPQKLAIALEPLILRAPQNLQ